MVVRKVVVAQGMEVARDAPARHPKLIQASVRHRCAMQHGIHRAAHLRQLVRVADEFGRAAALRCLRRTKVLNAPKLAASHLLL